MTARLRVATCLAALTTAVVALTGCAADSARTMPAAPSPTHAVALRVAPARPAASAVTSAAARPSTHSGPAQLRWRDRCRGTRADQLVVVSLAAQHLWLCHRGRAVRSFPITSGRPTAADRTPTGNFRVQGRNRNSTLTLAGGRQYDVRYWIPFDAPDFGFHDASWQRFPFGSPRYRTAGSHGCVHLPLAAIRFLYNWVTIGTRVTITAS